MPLRTEAADCLFVNWALPVASLPPVPHPLRYESQRVDGVSWSFVTLMCFRLRGRAVAGVPRLRLSYPQANLRLYVRDGDDVPSAFVLRTLVQPWIVPVVRVLAGRPSRAASLRLPRPGRSPEPPGGWLWRLAAHGTRLEVQARTASPPAVEPRALGAWHDVAEQLRSRSRTYIARRREVVSIEAARPPSTVWPLCAEVIESELLCRLLPSVEAAAWQRPHSSWLCPDFVVRLAPVRPRALELGRTVAAAARGA